MKKIVQSVRIGTLLLSLSLLGKPGWAQALAVNYQLPAPRSASSPETRRLRDVLHELKNHYRVDILFEGGLVDNLVVAADGIDYTQKLEQNLDKVLKTSGLHYKKIKDGAYLILDETKARKKASSRAFSISNETTPGNIPAMVNEPGKPAGVVSNQSALKSVEQTVASNISGKVTGTNREPLAGATVVLKGTNKGASVDQSGNFTITNVDEGKHLLVASYIGFVTKEVAVTVPQTGDLTITLEDDSKNLEEVIVTGVFDARKRIESSVAISTLSAKEINKQVPLSAADLLKNVPGVFVNSSLGEIRNTVYTRGLAAGSDDGATGYYYVSMQEDGLPVTNVTYTNYGPDFFLRPDATLGKLEAVRGGTASVVGMNAPGGIFNYISKSGAKKLEGEARIRVALEGDGKNPFYRADFSLGAPINADKSLTYNLGGFYRYANGARYPGYPMNVGGQIRANLQKTYKGGSFLLYGKYLDDHNGWFEMTPVSNFDNPTVPGGIKNIDNFLIPAVSVTFPINNTGKTDTYNPKNLAHSTEKSLGLNWKHTLGEGLTISNSAKYSSKRVVWNTTGVVYPASLNALSTYTRMGVGKPGLYTLTDAQTGSQLAQVQITGTTPTVLSSSLPGQSIQANSLFYEPLTYADHNVNEFMDNLNLTKTLENMSFTVGGFFASSRTHRLANSIATSYGTMQNQPHLARITYTDAAGIAYQVTDNQGVGGRSANGYGLAEYYANQTQFALYFGHSWKIVEKLNFDWGVRYENTKIDGSNASAGAGDVTTGGADKNPLTVYDNYPGLLNPAFSYTMDPIKTVSYSAALNYKFTEQIALYARYSDGRKAPDLDNVLAITSDATRLSANGTQPRKTQQLEFGFKLIKANSRLFITPFYSQLNSPLQAAFINTNGTSYLTPVIYRNYKTYGVEIESDMNLTKNWALRSVITLQDSKADDYQVWVANQPGPDDDTKQSVTGGKVANVPGVMINITPSYTVGKFYSSLTWNYMGKRAANSNNAFFLPAFSQFNLSAGYDVSTRFRLGANINNLFNTIGAMSWGAPADPNNLLAPLNREGFTKTQLEANVNALYYIISIQPRSYFLTATYKF